MIKELFIKILNRLKLQPDFKISYAQNGEDIIIENVLQWLSISNPSYIDIGTYHPTIINNTYRLYKKGYRGICVEPNPELFKEIKRVRKFDTCLNSGIGRQHEKKTFFVMSNPTLSTLDKEQAEYLQKIGTTKIKREVEIELFTFEEIINQYLGGIAPNFVSLDIEGFDFEILKSIDFKKYRPNVFCLETIDVHHNKDTVIINFMIERGYFICADTQINTIFVDEESWKNRPR